MMNRIKRIAFTLLICLLPVLIVGCGASEKEKKAMFKSLKKENLIEVGEVTFDDYTEIKTVSNAPVPGYTQYYIYECQDITYTICFEGYMENDEKIFRTEVKEATDKSVTNKYYFFKKGPIFGKMKLTESKYGFFSKDFTDDSEFGIEKIYYNGSVVSVNILKEADQREDDRLLQYAKIGLDNPENIPDIVCNIGGQDYQAEKVTVEEYEDSYVIEAQFEQIEPAQPLSWQCGDIVISLAGI